MSRTMRRVATGLAAAGLAATALVATTSQPASAGWVCENTGVCGTVTNSSASNGNILVAENWNDAQGQPTGPRLTLRPGQTSNGQLHDTDGYYIPAGCDQGYVYGPKWVKIIDTNQVTVKITC